MENELMFSDNPARAFFHAKGKDRKKPVGAGGGGRDVGDRGGYIYIYIYIYIYHLLLKISGT